MVKTREEICEEVYISQINRQRGEQTTVDLEIGYKNEIINLYGVSESDFNKMLRSPDKLRENITVMGSREVLNELEKKYKVRR